MFLKYIMITTLITVLVSVLLHEYCMSSLITLVPNLRVLLEFHSKILEWFVNIGSAPGNITSKNNIKVNEILFTKTELRKYVGGEGSPGLYLAILGKVYDVEKGRKHYGPGGSYHFFTGHDGSRAFITGDFSDSGLSEDVLNLTPQELISLNSWAKFYEKEYTYKGKLIGQYYDSNGNPTAYHNKVRWLIKEARKDKEAVDRLKLMFPPCNVEWSQESGSRVWCTNRSGGIQRDWIGVPRKLYEPGSDSWRCACVETDYTSGDSTMKANLQEYSGCDEDATSCWIMPT